MLNAADDKTRLFASGPLRTILSDAPLTPGTPSGWPQAWDTVDTSLHTPDNIAAEIDITATGYATNPAGQTVIAGYGYGLNDGKPVSGSSGIWVITRESDGTSHPPTALAGSAAASNAPPVVQVESAGVIHVFIITGLNGLLHFWQGEHGDWVTQPVSYQEGTIAKKVSTYRTAITVMDSQTNAPAAKLDIAVSADAEVEVEVNGKSYVIGGGETAGSFETSVLGQLNVSQVFEGSLGTPVLSFWVDGSGDPVAFVRPERDVAAQFRDISLSTLRTAHEDKVFDADNDELDELRKGLKLAAGMMTDGYNPPQVTPAAFKRTRNTRGTWFADHPVAADDYNPKGQVSASRPFRMDLSSNTPVFSLITSAEAEKRTVAAVAQRDDTIAALRLQGIFDIG